MNEHRPPAAAILAVPLVVLLVLTLFAWPSSRLEPRDLPVAVAGAPAAADAIELRLAGQEGAFDVHRYATEREARRAIDDREVYGAYDVAANRLYVASAANRATAIALEQTMNRAAAAQGRAAVRVTDVKPLSPKDPNGTAIFYGVIAWVFGGYIAATLVGVIGTPRSRSRTRGAARSGALAAFGLVAGILAVLMLRVCFGIFDGHVVALCAIAALTIFASGAATAGIQALAGPAGTALVILLFVILGNAASGGPFARPLLPGLWRTIGGVLPPGAAVDLGCSALFFDGARIAGPILVLAGWAVFGTVMLVALGGRVMSVVEAETEAAAGAAV